jgi:hypothetical protein
LTRTSQLAIIIHMKNTLPPRGEIAARGERIYAEKLRQTLEPEHIGEFVVVNVDTGEYELDPVHLAALNRACARWPESVFYAVRWLRRAGAYWGALASQSGTGTMLGCNLSIDLIDGGRVEIRPLTH